MDPSRFVRHLAIVGTPRGAGFFALGLLVEGELPPKNDSGAAEGSGVLVRVGLPNEKVVRATGLVGLSGTGLPSEKVRVLAGAVDSALGSLAPFAAR